ncbi:MAG: ROK family protein [Clostridia bacterium]|nr:ROK family protein [Clostridia bacterium]
MSECCLAIDIGGSKYVVGLVSRAGQILAKRRYAWTAAETGSVVRDIVHSAKALLAEHAAHSPRAVGATIPGLADPLRGLWVESSFLGIRNLPIAQALERELGLPAFADNDGQACALAEKLFGACRDTPDFLYVTVSNGIGASVFANGRLYGGSDGNAGELGHCTVVENGRPCKCGNHGCLEVHAAGPAIARNYTELGGRPLPDGSPADAAVIARRAREAEPEALAAYALEGEYLGKMLAVACNLLNPAKVVLGGGVSLAFPLFEQALKKTLWARLYRAANPNLAVLPTALGYDGGLLGAASVGFCMRERLFYAFF